MKSKKTKGFFLTSLALLAFGAILWALAFKIPVTSAGVRAVGLYSSAAFAKVFSVLPFALSEWILILLLPLLIFHGIATAKKFGNKRGFLSFLLAIFFLASLAVFLFMANHGVQYSAPPLAEALGLKAEPHSAEELQALDTYIVTQANKYAALVERDGQNSCDFGDFAPISVKVMESYRRIAALPPKGITSGEVFDTPRTAAPKKTSILGVPMSYLGISGYFFPFTGEAIVSHDSIAATLPFTIAHEAAHSHGIAPENEANFAAFLACTQGVEDVSLQYSGWFQVYIYVNNALYRENYDLWAEQSALRSPLLQQDLTELNDHVAKYETPVKQVGTAVNDTFIKATGQEGGVKTYGFVVDLLLAWYDNIK